MIERVKLSSGISMTNNMLSSKEKSSNQEWGLTHYYFMRTKIKFSFTQDRRAKKLRSINY